MNNEIMLSILSICVSIGALGLSLYIFFYNKQNAKKKIYFSLVNNNAKFLYIDFARMVASLDAARGDLTEKCNIVVDSIFNDVKPIFLDLKFRNEELYDSINKNLLELEDKIGKLINTNNFSLEYIEIKKSMKDFYSLLDRLYS